MSRTYWVLLKSLCAKLSPQTSQYSLFGPYFREGTWTPDRDAFEKYGDTPAISIGMLLQKYAVFLVGSHMFTTDLYGLHLRLVSRCLLQKCRGQ